MRYIVVVQHILLMTGIHYFKYVCIVLSMQYVPCCIFMSTVMNCQWNITIVSVHHIIVENCQWFVGVQFVNFVDWIQWIFCSDHCLYTEWPLVWKILKPGNHRIINRSWKSQGFDEKSEKGQGNVWVKENCISWTLFLDWLMLKWHSYISNH